jgi:peptidyl-prolyl cis-trans isomerase SurA
MLIPNPIVLAFATVLSGAVVLDRVAVVVGNRAVKTSDIERDLRASELLNSQPLDVSMEARKKAAQRLVEQELIRQEIDNGGYPQPSAQDVAAFVQQLKRDRFHGSDAQLKAALSRYGLSEEQFKKYLQWQLTVLRFIDQRFRPGVLVTDDEVREYYDEHRAELQKANPKNNSFEALQEKIRETLTGERVNKDFEEWLDETRRRTRIDFRDAAFQDAAGASGVSR